MRHLLIIAIVILTAARATYAQTSVSVGPDKCAELKTLRVPGVALTITDAQWFAAGPAPAQGPGPAAAPVQLPAYCRLDGMIDRRQGAGGQYGIGFAIALPGAWSGRFLMMGGGGLNGRVAPPYGGQVAGAMPALTRGFAVVSTDTGHQAGRGAFDG